MDLNVGIAVVSAMMVILLAMTFVGILLADGMGDSTPLQVKSIVIPQGVDAPPDTSAPTPSYAPSTPASINPTPPLAPTAMPTLTHGKTNPPTINVPSDVIQSLPKDLVGEVIFIMVQLHPQFFDNPSTEAKHALSYAELDNILITYFSTKRDNMIVSMGRDPNGWAITIPIDQANYPEVLYIIHTCTLCMNAILATIQKNVHAASLGFETFLQEYKMCRLVLMLNIETSYTLRALQYDILANSIIYEVVPIDQQPAMEGREINWITPSSMSSLFKLPSNVPNPVLPPADVTYRFKVSEDGASMLMGRLPDVKELTILINFHPTFVHDHKHLETLRILPYDMVRADSLRQQFFDRRELRAYSISTWILHAKPVGYEITIASMSKIITNVDELKLIAVACLNCMTELLRHVRTIDTTTLEGTKKCRFALMLNGNPTHTLVAQQFHLNPFKTHTESTEQYMNGAIQWLS
jgi:hypothetical protein